MAHQVEILLQVDIEGRNGPMALGNLRFLLHAEDTVIFVEFYHTCALELLDRGLLVAHDAGGLLLLCEFDKFAK